MRALIGMIFLLISCVTKAQELQISIQDITALGPDVGFLIENKTSEEMSFILNVIPRDCPELGLDIMSLKKSMSHIDSKGQIRPNDFMAAYYSLGTYNYKAPCVLDVYLETISGKTRKESSVLLNVTPLPVENSLYSNRDLDIPLSIKHSLKEMNDTHHELTLLLENRGHISKLVELKRLSIDCESGDVYIKQTDNFPDGIKNGRSEVKAMSWRAYKTTLVSTDLSFTCSVNASFEGAFPYNFRIEGSY